MNLPKIVAALGLSLACGLVSSSTAEAIWPFTNTYYGSSYGTYSSYYGPSYGTYSSYYGPSYGSYSTYYGPSRGYVTNPFAPLVPRRSGLGLFGRCCTTNYAPPPCGCSPCGLGGCSTGNCATGNCGISASSQQMKPTPDDPPAPPRSTPPTYDPTDDTPMDDRGFQEAPPGATGGFPEVDGTAPSTKSFKVPMKADEGDTSGLPEDKTPPVPPVVEPASESLEAPEPTLNYVPQLIDPRNSAQVAPTKHLQHKITWRSEPVRVSRPQNVATSRPLVVRRTVRIRPSEQPAMVVSRTLADK